MAGTKSIQCFNHMVQLQFWVRMLLINTSFYNFMHITCGHENKHVSNHYTAERLTSFESNYIVIGGLILVKMEITDLQLC